MLQTSPAPPSRGGQRERAKDGRRRRIIQAAHDLLRNEGMEALSGRKIAAQAGVSLSTPYNLFGAKDAVLVAVYADDLARYEALVQARASRDALARLFDAVDVATELYAEDPDFYRATMWRRAPGEPIEVETRHPRNRFWEDMVRAAQAEGALLPEADIASLGRTLVYLFSGALSDWVAGDLPLGRFARDIAFGFAATLLPFATPSAAARLHPYLKPLKGTRA
jgi:AcrR family transcriptional regulator